uniref:LOB domain-containing protein n=1 Tax=Fagus sylvatica TaxID=28930 RepID=A0A2N9GER9_FAGSY
MATLVIGNGEPINNRRACAACRHQRKMCHEDCLFAPHFPADKAEEYKAVHCVFDMSLMAKMFMGLNEYQREEAAKSIIWEAMLWQKDPVHGPLGQYKELEREYESLQEEFHQLGALLLKQWNIGTSSGNPSDAGILLPNNSQAAMNYGYYNDQGVQIGLQSPPMVAAPSISSRPVLMPMQGTHGYNNVAPNNMVQQGQERASQNLSHRVIQDNGINGGSVGGIDQGAVFQRSGSIGTSLQRLAALNLVQEENLTINRMEDWDADVLQMFSPSLHPRASTPR